MPPHAAPRVLSGRLALPCLTRVHLWSLLRSGPPRRPLLHLNLDPSSRSRRRRQQFQLQFHPTTHANATRRESAAKAGGAREPRLWPRRNSGRLRDGERHRSVSGSRQSTGGVTGPRRLFQQRRFAVRGHPGKGRGHHARVQFPFTRTRTHTHTRTHTRTRTRTHTQTHTRTRTHAHAHTRARAHTRAHTHAHARTREAAVSHLTVLYHPSLTECCRKHTRVTTTTLRVGVSRLAPGPAHALRTAAHRGQGGSSSPLFVNSL